MSGFEFEFILFGKDEINEIKSDDTNTMVVNRGKKDQKEVYETENE